MTTSTSLDRRTGFPTRTFLLLALGGGVVAFLLSPQAPIGQLLWPAPVPLDPEPEGLQLGLFGLLGVIDSLAFGAGLGVLLLAGPALRRLFPTDRQRLAAATHLCLFWLLWSWWLHDSLHLVSGLRTSALLALEYTFHVTLMVAAGLVIYALAVTARRGGASHQQG